jgi:hypothetical protein
MKDAEAPNGHEAMQLPIPTLEAQTVGEQPLEPTSSGQLSTTLQQNITCEAIGCRHDHPVQPAVRTVTTSTGDGTAIEVRTNTSGDRDISACKRPPMSK